MPNALTRLSDWANGRRKLVWLTLFVLVILVLAIVLTPVFLIMPFKSQTSRTMAISYVMRRWSPLLTLFASALILVLMTRLWLGGRWWSRIVLVLLLVPTIAATWLARQNHFEWMFNPLPNVSFAKTSDASFVADSDFVLAVHINDEAAAYPIRQIAYHHVIQDEVGGVAIAATY